MGAAVTTAVQTLVFDPRENAIDPGTTETTTFTVSVDDSGSAVSNDGTISAVTT